MTGAKKKKKRKEKATEIKVYDSIIGTSFVSVGRMLSVSSVRSLKSERTQVSGCVFITCCVEVPALPA